MPKQVWEFAPTGRWVQTTFQGETIASSKKAMLMIESRYELDYFFPLEDVRQDLLVESDHTETSGYRGTRRFWHVRVGDHLAENAAWTYDPKDKRPDFTGTLAFDWNAMDHWYEEEEEVFLHARHPYHRVDTIKSNRHVEVFVDGVKLADTIQPYLLFETGIKTRYYLPAEDVQMEYLFPTETHSICPYKGVASYYNMQVNGETYADAVFTYPDPIPETPKIKGLLVFWPEKDKRIQIVVDGEVQP
jgi:uncharacterized protein (DUF427 family)